MNVIYQTLTKELEEATKHLIIRGLESHWGKYDPKFNPDISDLYATYSSSNMLVGLYRGVVVSCFGWKELGRNTAELVRVSVSQDYQRTGVGSELLKEAEMYLHNLGYELLVLETTSSWVNVVKFYLKNGYLVTHSKGGDTYFQKILSN